MNGYKASLIICLWLPLAVTASEQGQRLILGNFSDQAGRTLPAGWLPMTFDNVENHTRYHLTGKQHTILKAESHNAASGLTYKVRFDPKDYPYLSWRWRVDKTLRHSDFSKKSGDDFPARIYVMFDYDINKLPADEQFRIKLYHLFKGVDPPLATLNYIWAGHARLNQIASSPYTERVKMLVVKNYQSRLQHWYQEERNIVEDYKDAFGEEPGHVVSIAIMTDSDNTGDMATGLYGDIFISKTPQSK